MQSSSCTCTAQRQPLPEPELSAWGRLCRRAVFALLQQPPPRLIRPALAHAVLSRRALRDSQAQECLGLRTSARPTDRALQISPLARPLPERPHMQVMKCMHAGMLTRQCRTSEPTARLAAKQNPAAACRHSPRAPFQASHSACRARAGAPAPGRPRPARPHGSPAAARTPRGRPGSTRLPAAAAACTGTCSACPAQRA